LSIYECSCLAGKIWNNYLNTCIDIPSGLAIANAKMKFKCASPKVFDIVTKTCVAKCTTKSCLDCTKIPYTTGAAAVAYDAKSSNVKVFPQGDKVVK